MSQTWVIKDTAPVDDASLYISDVSCSFSSNGKVFSGMHTYTDQVYFWLYYDYSASKSEEVAILDLGASSSFEWYNEAYKTLVFDTAPTGELLAWLQKNADAPIIDTLVTDRTQADVERVRELAAKGFAAMTAAEQAEWLAGMKGAYNAADLNRVGTALNYLAGRLGEICGRSIAWTAKTYWAVTDIITASQAVEYRRQIQDIRDALTYPTGTPDAPQLNRLTYTGANDIERILALCEELIDNITKAFRYTGAAECATGGLI